MKINHSTQHEKIRSIPIKRIADNAFECKKNPPHVWGGLEMQQHYNYLI